MQYFLFCVLTTVSCPTPWSIPVYNYSAWKHTLYMCNNYCCFWQMNYSLDFNSISTINNDYLYKCLVCYCFILDILSGLRNKKLTRIQQKYWNFAKSLIFGYFFSIFCNTANVAVTPVSVYITSNSSKFHITLVTL